MILVRLIVIMIIGVGMLWVNLNYVQPYGMLGEGHEYCKNLTYEGYFEDEHETAGHRNCTIDYEDGINNDKKWRCPFRENCFSYDSYDHECEVNIDMKDFGMRCVWGGLGWMATGFTIMLWGFVAMIVFITFFALLNDGKDEPTDEPTGEIYKK